MSNVSNGSSRGYPDDPAPRSAVGRGVSMIHWKAEVPGVVSAEARTGTRPGDRAEAEREIERGTEHLPRSGNGDRRHGVRGDGGARGRSLVQISLE